MGILQARILEWVSISFSRGSSQPRYGICISCIVGRFFTIWVTKGSPKMWPQKTILPTSYSHEGWEWEPFRLPVLGVTMNPGLKILTCRFRNHTLSFHLRGTDSHRLKTDWVPDQNPYFIYLVSEPGIHCPEPASLLWEGPLRSKAVYGGQNWARGVGSSVEETVSALSPELWESPPCVSTYTRPSCPWVMLHFAARVIISKPRSEHDKIHILPHHLYQHHHQHHHSCNPSVAPQRPEGMSQARAHRAGHGLASPASSHHPEANRPGPPDHHACFCQNTCAYPIPSAWDTLSSLLPHLSSYSALSLRATSSGKLFVTSLTRSYHSSTSSLGSWSWFLWHRARMPFTFIHLSIWLGCQLHGGLVVQTLHFQCRGRWFHPWSGN